MTQTSQNSAISIFKKNEKRILERWIEIQLQEDGLQEDIISNEELRSQSEELLHKLTVTLTDNNIDKPGSADFQPVGDILSGISLSRAKQGFTPRETGIYIFCMKDALLHELQMAITEPRELYNQSLKVIKLVDHFGVLTLESFIEGREDVIRRQTGEMDEISTPVIKVWDGILALPIIGTLDSSRTQTVMENLLIKIVETGSEVAILDISGVPTVDSLVAQHLMKTVSATRLMGAECIISGIRPEIAQTIVHLGIDLSSIVTKATLANALKAAFNILSLRVESKLLPPE